MSMPGPQGVSRLKSLAEFGGVKVAVVGGQLLAVQVGPHGGFGVEGAFDVVGLAGEHLTDADDQVDKSFARGPVVADADRGGVDVGVEDRRQHPALGAKAGIIGRELDFH